MARSDALKWLVANALYLRYLGRMKVLVTGSNGLVGSEVVKSLTAAGHYVVRLVRGEPDRSRGDVVWDPVSGSIERTRLRDIEAVIHLAGENILGLWSTSKKERIHKSRVTATEYLSEALAGLSPRPSIFIAASAAGFYGNRGDTRLTESAAPGQGFLAQLCREWEDATVIARNAGIRVVNMRIGVVLSTRGGALQKMLPPFKLGLGGILGNGRQYMSWISISDLVDAILFAMETPALTGPVNGTAPMPVTNKEFTKTLARALHRPAIFPVPAFVLNALPGGMGRETFLSSARIEPDKLLRAGFKFRHPDLESALGALLG
jgi:uncharacterized protein (TIGR01777 family)